MVEQLIEQGADVHARNDKSLRVASANGHARTVELQCDARDGEPLRRATKEGVVDVLLEYGADMTALYDI